MISELYIAIKRRSQKIWPARIFIQIHKVYQQCLRRNSIFLLRIWNIWRASKVLKAIKAESVSEEERNHTSLSLKWIRMEVNLKPRISYYPPLFQDTFKVKAHMGCVDLLRTLELSDKLPGGHQRRSLASRHILQLRKNQGESPWQLVWNPTWNSQWTLQWTGYWITSVVMPNKYQKNSC